MSRSPSGNVLLRDVTGFWHAHRSTRASPRVTAKSRSSSRPCRCQTSRDDPTGSAAGLEGSAAAWQIVRQTKDIVA